MKNAALAVILVIALTAPALARSQSAQLTVSTSVMANCRIAAPFALNFGTYHESNTDGKPIRKREKVLLIACTKGAMGVDVGLSHGRHWEHKERHMTGPHHERVAYQIYTSAKHKTVWDESHTVKYVPRTDQPTYITMFGEVFGKQNPRAGEYHDTLVATVNF